MDGAELHNDFQRLNVFHLSLDFRTYFAYNRVDWNLNVRKEVFSPSEVVNSPLAINLIFCQVCVSLLLNLDEPVNFVAFSDRSRRVFSPVHPPDDVRAVADEDAAGRVRRGRQQRLQPAAQAQHQEEHHRDGQRLQRVLCEVRTKLLQSGAG